MTDVYERDLYGMKFSILKSPYHNAVITTCAHMLGVPPMIFRRLLIEKLDMMMLESLGARYDSWKEHGDPEGGLHREIGYDLFTSFIPVIPLNIMKQAITAGEGANDEIQQVQSTLQKLMFEAEDE